MDRRTFLHVTAAGCAAGCASVLLPACATVPTLTPRVDGDVLLVPSEQLLAAEQAWYLSSGAGPVILLRQATGFAAVSGVCTHLECRLRPSGTFLRCPCHGSTFEPDGAVVRGPATRPLPTYAVRETPAGLEIVVPQ
jgi:nitrite reductase/ring-hydroxylating ferredoxin subunit